MNSIQEILSRVWPGWIVEERLGKGAFGQVFKISREVMGRRAERAMKVMHIPTNQSEAVSLAYMNMDDAQIKAYFEKTARSIANEYMIMESLKGAPNIVQVEEAELVPDDDGPGWTILIRMEMLEPIRSYHKRVGYPDEKEVIRIGEDICSALEYCGMKHIIHRDIKPENVFRNEFGVYKLGDFGISRQLEHTQAMYSRKGTVSYMAPEVYYGRKYDETADIYSLGIMLYRYMNRQRMPFVPTDTEELTPEILEEASGRRVSGERLPAPVDASPALSRVILKACDPDPMRRYRSAKEFKKALLKCLRPEEETEWDDRTLTLVDDETVLLPESGKKTGVKRKQGNGQGNGEPDGPKRRLVLAVAVIAALLLLVVGGRSFIKGRNPVASAPAPTSEPESATEEVAEASPVQEQETESEPEEVAEASPVQEQESEPEPEEEASPKEEAVAASYVLPNVLPDDLYYYNGHSYAFYDASKYGFKTYDQISDFCHEEGGHLAVINDRSENNFLYNLMKENYKITVFFGYTDKDEEGTWVWDGDESEYENWTRSGDWNLPDNGESWGGGEWKDGGEDYAEFNYDRETNWGAPNDTTWNDAAFMENTTIFFCEWEYDIREVESLSQSVEDLK